MTTARSDWPDLSTAALLATIEPLQLWTQVVGKVRMALTPWENHSWHVPLYVSARGLTTGPIPGPQGAFEMEFDLLSDRLVIADTAGRRVEVVLKSQSVAHFYHQTLAGLAALDIHLVVNPMPCEIQDAVAFPADQVIRAYDPEVARAYWRALVKVQQVFQAFRTRFIGKCSPTHLFWGAFDLAVTRFSGRTAPAHRGQVPNMPDAVAREAYSHELSSAGFWPGTEATGGPSFYSYAYPEPKGFSTAQVRPSTAVFDHSFGEFLLPYADVRASADPDRTLLEFLESTYVAAATLAHWERDALERSDGPLGRPPEGS